MVLQEGAYRPRNQKHPKPAARTAAAHAPLAAAAEHQGVGLLWYATTHDHLISRRDVRCGPGRMGPCHTGVTPQQAGHTHILLHPQAWPAVLQLAMLAWLNTTLETCGSCRAGTCAGADSISSCCKRVAPAPPGLLTTAQRQASVGVCPVGCACFRAIPTHTHPTRKHSPCMHAAGSVSPGAVCLFYSYAAAANRHCHDPVLQTGTCASGSPGSRARPP